MSRIAGGSFKKINLLISTTPALRATPPHLRGFAQKVGNGHVTFYASRKEGNTFLFTSVQHEPRLRNLSVRVCCITPSERCF